VYEAHFGLTRRPFAETVAPRSFIALPSRDSVLRRLRYGLAHGEGPALVFGPPGTGKTLLARVLADELGGVAAHVPFPALPATELLAVVAEELGAAAAGMTLGSTIRHLRRHLAAAAARGERPLLIIDEAQLIDDPATFEAIRLLLNFTSTGAPDLGLLLLGGPEVLLRLPPALLDRLTARCLLGPLTEAEASTYLLGRLAAAGATVPLFGAEEIAVLHRAADGLPRRLNRLADLALLIAYAEALPCTDLRAVTMAAREAELDSLAA
jgi:type II secretory pathway predicted ATPase ExeA